MESITKLYKVIIKDKEGNLKTVEYSANGATHAWYIASELHPGCEISVEMGN